jgi:aminopeptidase N
VLEAWRKDLLVNRHFPLGGEKQAGPIWLGPRTNSSATPDDYSLIIYEKGAWVLHMLRNYLLDDASGDEHRFRGLLRDFYQRWAGRKAFTEDFRAAAEKAAGEDLGWFFEQWVYGTDVPTYKVHWAWTPADGGQWRIHGRIEQAQVPASFRMPVFVRVDFADGSYSGQRVWVRGPVTELDLPLAPKKPAGVVFNDLQSVLCEVERQP